MPSEKSRRATRLIPGYGKKLSALMSSCDLTLADLGHVCCVSSATISRAVHQDLVSRRTHDLIVAGCAQFGRRRLRLLPTWEEPEP